MFKFQVDCYVRSGDYEKNSISESLKLDYIYINQKVGIKLHREK